MNEKNINKSSSFFRVLIAPLDWGLGHATRCIPIIHTLLEKKTAVFIAAEGAILNLLQKEFPGVNFLPLAGYKVSYPSKKHSFTAKMLRQVPRVLATIKHEKKWLAEMIREHSIDAVISDNRFGLYNKNIRSIYITHQLHIETNHSFLNKLAQKIHYRYINHYDECWVPDAEGNLSLAGKLSHPKSLPQVPVKYLGPLSRFKKMNVEKKYELLILISGPEPQRTFFEELLLKQINDIDGPVAFVRGLPATSTTLTHTKNDLFFYDHLPAEELSMRIQQSKMVVCRSGYSTVMDLSAIQQKAILVPTPAQTEQEYLAEYLFKNKFFFTAKQDGFDLKATLKNAANFSWKTIPTITTNLHEVITSFLNGLKPDPR